MFLTPCVTLVNSICVQVTRCIAGSLFLLLCSPLLGQSEIPRSLILSGSGGIANWDQEFNSSLRDELGPDLGQFFNSEILPLIGATTAERELIADSLALKYSGTEIGLVVAVLSEANDFVTEWVQRFAPNAAILRVLPSDNYLEQENTLPNPVVILASAIDRALSETAKLLPLMLPDLENIYLIGGAGEGDLAYMQRYQASLMRLDLPYHFEYLSGYPADELIEILSSAPANSAVMTTTYDVDRSGRPMRSLILTRQMNAELEMPILALANPQIAAGAIGGNITTQDSYARAAVELITGMIEGVFPGEPVIPENEYIFNGEQLDRFNVDRSILPEGSIIINDVPNLWRDYGRWIALVLLVIILQAVLIILLLAARRRSQLAEARLNQVRKMEALGTLAGGIAHDFNNILMSIMANAELLSMQSEENVEAQNRISRILSASERAKSLISQILLFSRKGPNTEIQPLDLKQVVEESAEHVRSFLPPACSLTVNSDASSTMISGDASQLHQIVLNVCVNAQHAMDGKGNIAIKLYRRSVKEKLSLFNQIVPLGEYVVLEVTDTGYGISEANLAHIFEPFFTTKSPREGTGLGLALVYQILKAHRGYIDIESEVNAGTTVSIYFPSLGEEFHRPANLEASGIVLGNKEHILLVDDDELVLDANRALFSSLGYRTTHFSSSVSALNEYRNNPDAFDLLYTDLSMPGMDGVRLISNIRKLRKDLPIVLCTGYIDALNAAEFEDVQVLSKPASLIDISQAIDKALRRD